MGEKEKLKNTGRKKKLKYMTLWKGKNDFWMIPGYE